MELKLNISKFEKGFAGKYGSGTVVETTIISKINPSQIVTAFAENFVGRLSVLNISWCLPEGEDEFKSYKIGDQIKCMVLAIDFPNKQVVLSKKHLSEPLSKTGKWERIERGDEYYADIIESFNNTTLVKTKNNLYGIINNKFLPDATTEIRVKVNSKQGYGELISFVPASIDMGPDDLNKSASIPEISFIEEDLLSFYSFRTSLLGTYASDEQLELIKKGFDIDEKLFSKELTTNKILYIQFELGSASYEVSLKQNAISYFLYETSYTLENENKVLEHLSNQHYWFKMNIRETDQKVDFSLYNEDINFYGDVVTKDKKELKFVIKDFSFGHSQIKSSEAKKRNAKYGSFYFNNKLKVISPYSTTPFDKSQQEFLDYAKIKTRCFETISLLKNETGEILRQEGRTLSIIDKFLEYQIGLIDKQKENNVFVKEFSRISGNTQGVAIKIPSSIGDSLEIDDDTVVNIRLKENESLLKLSDGVLSNSSDEYIITFNKPVNLGLLNKGFSV